MTNANRRQWTRLQRFVRVDYRHKTGLAYGYTLDVSMRGARMVVRHPLGRRFPISLQLDRQMPLEAETIWSQCLSATSWVVGVRFHPVLEQESQLERWLALQGRPARQGLEQCEKVSPHAGPAQDRGRL